MFVLPVHKMLLGKYNLIMADVFLKEQVPSFLAVLLGTKLFLERDGTVCHFKLAQFIGEMENNT